MSAALQGVTHPLQVVTFPRTDGTPAACDILTSLHSGPGASIAFMAGRPGGGPLYFAGASRADELTANWDKLPEDVPLYFSINSTGTVYQWENSLTGFGVSRKAQHIRFLNAAFIEFDRHDNWESVSFPALAANVHRQAEYLGLPAPTFTVYSGRGVWAIWQFSQPIKATAQAKEHWQRTGRALLAAFSVLNPDEHCSADLSRIMRVPGSINSGAAGHVVTFERTGGPVEFYGFARVLGVHAAPTPITKAETEKREKNVVKARAARMRWQKLYRGFKKLAAMRGQFASGHRSWAVFTLAKLGRLAGIDPDTIKAECLNLGLQGCSPALDTGEIRRKIKSGMDATGPGQWMSLEGVCGRFAVTQGERDRIPELQAAYRRTERARANGKPYYDRIRPETRKTRAVREIRLLAVDLGRVPTFAEICGRFLAQGLSVQKRSVYRYLKTLLTTGVWDSFPPSAGNQKTACDKKSAGKYLQYYCSSSFFDTNGLAAKTAKTTKARAEKTSGEKRQTAKNAASKTLTGKGPAILQDGSAMVPQVSYWETVRMMVGMDSGRRGNRECLKDILFSAESAEENRRIMHGLEEQRSRLREGRSG